MAPVSFEAQVRYTPLILVASHLAVIIHLSYLVVSGLFRSRKELRPAHDTRHRAAQRKAPVRLFASLAAVSLVLAAYSAVRYATLSYQVWADERGVAVPDGIDEAKGAQGAKGTPVYLEYWLTDTPVYTDAWEIVVEKARRLWWGQQLDLALVPWTMLLAVEGRRRNVPHLWAYLSLAHLVSLSFSQNLFYLAMLLTPSRLPNRDRIHGSRISRITNRFFPPKAANWSPSSTLMGFLLVLNHAAILLQPYMVGSSFFLAITMLSKALSFAPLVAPAILPESWGVFHAEPHDAYRGVTRLFRLIAVTSLVLHSKATVLGLLYNLPDSYQHRHSIRIPFDTEKRTALDRTTTAVQRLLGSTADHPVVAAAGRDVMLCAISLGIWAAIRGLDPGKMLPIAVPFFHTGETSPSIEQHHSDERAANRAIATKEQPPPQADEHPMILRHRSRHSRVDSVASSNGGDDISTKRGNAHHESQSPTPMPAKSPKRRGRPRKIKVDSEEEPGDETFEPSLALQAAIVGEQGEADEMRHRAGGDLGGISRDADWESAALAWGLTTLGGLGVGSAATFGAECVAR